ncbi:hypothetical protein ACP275_07G102400 [Erythranthe tilingii]
METREVPPAHFLIKIESFSLFDKYKIKKYETSEFVAGEYKWKLILNFNGKDSDYISVNLAMADTSSLPANWELNAAFSIFLFNQKSGNYLHSPGITRRFQAMKFEWGLSKFISKEILCDPSNGYLVNDTCVFGADVFVIKREAAVECLSLENVDICYKHDLKISDFSKLEETWNSADFIDGGQKWKIILYPKGNGEGNKSHVSIFLSYLGSERMQICFTICLKNQLYNDKDTNDDKHVKETLNHWFSAAETTVGWRTFIELATINDPNKGFIVKDGCLLSIEIHIQAIACLPIKKSDYAISS